MRVFTKIGKKREVLKFFGIFYDIFFGGEHTVTSKQNFKSWMNEKMWTAFQIDLIFRFEILITHFVNLNNFIHEIIMSNSLKIVPRGWYSQ